MNRTSLYGVMSAVLFFSILWFYFLKESFFEGILPLSEGTQEENYLKRNINIEKNWVQLTKDLFL
jgi:hypothetical protein